MKYYGQFDPPVDKFLYERYFKNFRGKGFYIECGAFDGITESSCKFFEETCGWKGVNVEASPPIFKLLEKNRPDSINVNLGLGSKNENMTFTHVIHPILGEKFGNGSLSHTQEHLEDLIKTDCKFMNYSIKVITWADLVQNLEIDHVDLFVLDVEGTDLDVIKGMEGCSILPKILCVEHNHFGGVNPLKKILEPMGYVYDTSLFINSFFIHVPSFKDKIKYLKLKYLPS